MGESKCCISNCDNEVILIVRDNLYNEYSLCSKHCSNRLDDNDVPIDAGSYAKTMFHTYYRNIEFTGI